MSDKAVTRQHREAFFCPICERTIEQNWNFVGPHMTIAPICSICEWRYTERVARPKAGAFRDRRIAMQIYALAEALHCAAMRIRWKDEHASA